MLSLDIVLFIATLLSSLVAGFLFAFAVVVMPGIARMSPREYVQAFRAIDGVIQRGQPLFGLVWLGSAVAMLTAAIMAPFHLEGLDLTIVAIAAGVFLVGTHIPTFAINVPLNNALQRLDIDALDEESARQARLRFESRWNRSNVFRTLCSILASSLLLVALVRI